MNSYSRETVSEFEFEVIHLIIPKPSRHKFKFYWITFNSEDALCTMMETQEVDWRGMEDELKQLNRINNNENYNIIKDSQKHYNFGGNFRRPF